VGTNQPLQVPFTRRMLDEAKVLSGKLNACQGGNHLKKSFMHGAGTMYGVLGELIVATITWSSGLGEKTFDYDLVTPLGKRLEVKTKKTKSPPKAHYECSVSCLNTTQKCDYYVFVRVSSLWEKTNNESDMIAWICGRIKRDDFISNSVKFSKGQADPSNGYIVRSDCLNIAISELEALPWADEGIW
jgi:hypothetical protein